VKAVLNDGTATVSFTAPPQDATNPVTYMVLATDTTSPTNGGQSASGTQSPLVVSGLTIGDAYVFTVTATVPAAGVVTNAVAADNGAHLVVNLNMTNPSPTPDRVHGDVQLLGNGTQVGGVVGDIYRSTGSVTTSVDLPAGSVLTVNWSGTWVGLGSLVDINGPMNSLTASGACIGTSPNITCQPLVNGIQNVTFDMS
jgi:hypothetical protein